MADISLREYVELVEASLHAGDHTRAIALCQHALQSLPRCVEFYTLLGRACLASDQLGDAADLFRRVLGADPEHFDARMGLGIVAQALGARGEATWQFERALELRPNDSEVRERLHRLSKGRHSAARIKLSRAALGRVYMRGEQYERAAAEFRRVLDHLSADDDRPDVRVALAEALYRAGRPREASDVCRELLDGLPNALKPNLLLGSIYLHTDRAEEARPLLERAQSLDPENRLATALLDPTPLEPRTIMLELPVTATRFATMPNSTAALTVHHHSATSVADVSAVPMRANAVLEGRRDKPEPLPEEAEQMTPEPQPLAPAEPVVTEEAMEQPAPSRETQTEVPAPSEPIVTEETMEPPREPKADRALLDHARLLRAVDWQQSAAQYKILVGSRVLLPQVIDDLTQWVQAQPTERALRMLLADALTNAERFDDAIEQYRALV
ncbi:MAG: tetratricopeptide repeat protein [Chloroflexi bacterium]|nr:tetratricopeptide repeat protein [Chloroflexota bacterium]